MGLQTTLFVVDGRPRVLHEEATNSRRNRSYVVYARPHRQEQ